MNPPPADVNDVLSRVIAVVRRMSPGRLREPLRGPYPTRADAGRTLARALLVAVQGIEEAESATLPRWRTLPDVRDPVVGDQLSVMAHDLARALADSRAREVWTTQGRAPLADVVRDVLATAREVHRLL